MKNIILGLLIGGISVVALKITLDQYEKTASKSTEQVIRTIFNINGVS